MHSINDASRRIPRLRETNDPDTRRLETELAEKLGAPVRIEAGRNGSGRLVIRYASLEELDGILAKLA